MASCSTRSLKGIGQCPHSRNGTAKSSGGSWCCLFVRRRWRQRRMLLLFHANNTEENTPVVARSGLQVELAPETGDYKCNRGCGILYPSFSHRRLTVYAQIDGCTCTFIGGGSRGRGHSRRRGWLLGTAGCC